ncbi:MAG: 4-hydroxythreonine-4-phosphate dehydrogenase PdxA [Caulobacteraceae bacterium]|nr:4-hydroxythreonine-4-phosphate dehydrogenase PdxA [Caulobacteraceae bacterium]
MNACLALSLGEPAGIGPEIVLKAWSALKGDGPPFMVVGDAAALASAPGAGSTPIQPVGDCAQAAEVFARAVPVLDLPLPRPAVPGRPDPGSASSVIAWIERGARLALSGEASALVTAPIAKKPLYDAGFAFPGHTEFLGELARDGAAPSGPVMMLAAKGLKVALVTIHEPLAKVAGLITTARIAQVGRTLAAALRRDFGLANPHIAVAGLNPHAGEDGALGDDERRVIAPAVAALRGEGIDANGPHPADTLFHPEARRRYDAVLAMYHDQGLIPVKMLDFWGGVNLTLGLPLVRASPDHGVGLDIAGRGVARPDSLIAALRLAAAIAERRARA